MGNLKWIFLVVIVALPAKAKVDPDKWDKIVEMVLETGEQSEAGAEVYFEYKSGVGDKNNNHTNYGLTIKSYLKSNGKFQAKTFHTIDDYRVNADGNWVLDQWFIHVSAEGELSKENHQHIQRIISKDRYILGEKYFDITDEEVAAKWVSVYQYWLKVSESYKSKTKVRGRNET